MEQMWEKKWNSFKKNKPKTIHNNDNILRSLDEELLNELTQDQKNKSLMSLKRCQLTIFLLTIFFKERKE